MSLKKKFVKAFARAGVASPLSLKNDFYAAIDRDDGAEIAALLKLDPRLVPGQNPKKPGAGKGPATDAFVYAASVRKGKALQTLARLLPGLLSATDSNGRTALMREARAPSSAESFSLLLRVHRQSHIMARDKHGNTALHHAATQTAGTQAAAELLPYFKDADIRNDAGETPLMLAGQRGVPAQVDLLLEAGANLHATDPRGDNATMHAIRNGNFDTATRLLEAGGIVDFDDPVIEKQIGAAWDGLKPEFLKRLDARQKTQTRKETQSLKDAKIGNIVNAMGRGAGRGVRAPRTARFAGKTV